MRLPISLSISCLERKVLQTLLEQIRPDTIRWSQAPPVNVLLLSFHMHLFHLVSKCLFNIQIIVDQVLLSASNWQSGQALSKL